MHEMSYWLYHYGYFAVLLGCLLEGETIVVLAGMAVHKGFFSLPVLIGVVWFGGMLGDIALYFTGRYFGKRVLKRFESQQARIQRVHRLIERHPWLVVFGVRFLYGLRIIGPVVIGSSAIKPATFLLLNMLGAAVWATLFTLLGFLIGPAVLRAYAHIEQYQSGILISLILLVLLWAGWKYLRRQAPH